MTLEDIRSSQITRSALEKVYLQPYFAKYVVGLYCRLNIGTENRRAKYRICKIIGVKRDDKTYSFVRSDPPTNLLLRLKHPRGSSSFEMRVISNSAFTQEEFSSWVSMLDCPPTRFELSETLRLAELTRKKFRHTHATLQKLKEERDSVMPSISRIWNLTTERIKLDRALETAKA